MSKLNANLIAWRIGLFGSLTIGSWCVMTTTHEMGHVAGGWLSGARLIQSDLRPWAMPFSLFDPDPKPLMTLWSGPISGAVIPLIAATAIRRPMAWFVAWFCVLANGVYIALGRFTGDRFLDTTQLLDHGASSLSIAVFCTVTIALGYRGFRKCCLDLLRSPADFQGTVERDSNAKSE